MGREQEVRAWLDTSDAIRSACDLDLLRFLTQHSQVLLTTEQIANFVGYSRSEIDEALEHLVTGGLITRLRGRAADVDLYSYSWDEAAAAAGSGALLSSLLQFASTRDGRLAIIDMLTPPRTLKGVKHDGA